MFKRLRDTKFHLALQWLPGKYPEKLYSDRCKMAGKMILWLVKLNEVRDFSFHIFYTINFKTLHYLNIIGVWKILRFIYHTNHKFMEITSFSIPLIKLPPTQTRDSNVALTATPSISTALHIFVPVLSILIELDLLICTLNKQKLSFVTKPYHVVHQISLNPIACLERHELKKLSVFRLSNIF